MGFHPSKEKRGNIMICPNCGAPLPDSVSMCYSCRMVFKPMNQQIQSQQANYVAPIHPHNMQAGYTATRTHRKPLIKPTVGELVLPVITWIAAYISCFFPYFEIYDKNGLLYSGKYCDDKGFMIYITIACIVYFVFMFGAKKLHKKILQTTICVIIMFMKLIMDSNVQSIYDSSPNRENEVLKMNYASNLLWSAILALLLYTIYTIARDYKKGRFKKDG